MNCFLKKYLFFLFVIISNTVAASSAHELTLYFIPSPKGIDWSSPKNLLTSAILNKLTFERRFIGHVFVEMKCGKNEELTGMTSQKMDYLNLLFFEQKGLGILFHSFEGSLENKESIKPELDEYLKKGSANFVRFLLNEGQCQRASTYLKEYREKNVGRNYGLANRPLYGEGAGCSAFGVSFVDVLGLLNQDLKDAWSQTIHIPLDLSGPPLTIQSVSIFKLLFNADKWANVKEKHRSLTFWDPDRMFKWVKEKVQSNSSKHSISKLGNSEGIIIDKSHYPAPLENIWRQDLSKDNLSQSNP
jgi:hypothetical protein